MTNSSGSKGFLSGRLKRLTVIVALLVFVVVLGFAVFALALMLLEDVVWRGGVSVTVAHLIYPDRLALSVSSCLGDPEVTLLHETDVYVLIKVVASSTPLKGGNDCGDIVEVQLQQPLGDRILIDKHTGQSVNVSVAY